MYFSKIICRFSCCCFVLKFTCLKFHTKLISFCQIIAVLLGVHFLCRHTVIQMLYDRCSVQDVDAVFML